MIIMESVHIVTLWPFLCDCYQAKPLFAMGLNCQNPEVIAGLRQNCKSQSCECGLVAECLKCGHMTAGKGLNQTLEPGCESILEDAS